MTQIQEAFDALARGPAPEGTIYRVAAAQILAGQFVMEGISIEACVVPSDEVGGRLMGVALGNAEPGEVVLIRRYGRTECRG